MADRSNVVELIFRVNNQASAGINQIGQDIQRMGRSVESGPLGALGRLQSSFGALAGAAGVGLLIQGFKTAISAAAEADKSLRQMASSVELAGSSMATSGAAIGSTIKRLFDTTQFDDEALQDALSNLVTRTGDLQASLKSLPVVADLAAKTGSDLSSAVQTIGLAAEGSTRGLKQLGISFTEAQQKAFMLMSEGERLNITLGLIAEKTSGAAAANVASWGGELAKAGKDLKEVWETVGGGIFTALHAMDTFFLGFRQHVIDAQRIVATSGGSFSEYPDVASPTANVAGITTGHHITQYDPNAVASGPAARGLLAMSTDLAGWNTEAQKARATTAAWKSDADQLVESMKNLGKNVADVTGRTGDGGQAIQHYVLDLVRLGDQADALGVSFPANFQKMIEAARELQATLLPPLPQATRTLENLFDIQNPEVPKAFLGDQGREIAKEIEKGIAAAGAQLKRDAEEAGRIFVERFEQPMTDIFADLALTGGKNFGQIAGRMFEQSVRDGAKIFVDLISSGLDQAFGGGGRVTQDAAGNFFIGGQPATQEEATAAQQKQGRIGQIAGAAIGAGSNIYSALTSTGTQRQSALGLIGGTALSGASIGAVAGGGAFSWAGAAIGAIIGAVVGGVTALLQPPQGADYAYGRYGVRGGQAFFESSPRGGSGDTGQLQNISANAARAAQAQIEAAFAQTYGDFLHTLLRFPTEVLPATFSAIGDVLPQIGKDAGGDMGRAASALFWKDFELWFRQGMPRDIAERFRPVFEQAFTGMGYTVTRFGDIWDQLQLLDPEQARKLLDQWATFSSELPKIFDYLELPFAGRGGLLDTAQRDLRQTPAERLADSFDPIYRLVDTISGAPLEVQIQQWGEINRLVADVQQNVKDFMAEIAEGIRSVTESFGASIRDLELAGIQTATGAPDYQGQAEYLRNYANDLRARIGAATSPQEAQALGEELRSTIGQIYQLGQELGPAAGEEFRKWALEALTEGRDVVLDQLRELGQAVADENAAFLERLRGPWEEFTGQAISAGDALDDFVDAINGAIDTIGGIGGRIEPPIIQPPGLGPNSATSSAPPTTPPAPTLEVATIGREIGDAFAAAMSRSDALAAIAEAGRGLAALSQTPTPLPAIPVTTPKPEVIVLPAPAPVPVFDNRERDASLGAFSEVAAIGEQISAGLIDVGESAEQMLRSVSEAMAGVTSGDSVDRLRQYFTDLYSAFSVPTEDPEKTVGQFNERLRNAVSGIGDVSADDAAVALARARERIKASFVDLGGISGGDAVRALGKTADGIRAALLQFGELRPPTLQLPEVPPPKRAVPEPAALPLPASVPVFEDRGRPADDALALIRGWTEAIAASVRQAADVVLKRAADPVAPPPSPAVGRGSLSAADGGSTFAGAMLSRMDRLEKTFEGAVARAAQINAGGQQSIVSAVLSSKGDITIPITLQGGGGPTASNAGPSTRRGR